jgi:hypothetical protein
MRRDVKEIIGTLMRVIDGDEVSTEELGELSFEAEGELQLALKRTSSSWNSSTILSGDGVILRLIVKCVWRCRSASIELLSLGTIRRQLLRDLR